jgi:hypothetical protein
MRCPSCRPDRRSDGCYRGDGSTSYPELTQNGGELASPDYNFTSYDGDAKEISRDAT